MEVTRDRVLGGEFHVVPARVDAALGMLSERERHLLFNLTESHYRGEGAIVDAGSFIGSSTVALAEGLKANPRLKSILKKAKNSLKPIVSYDIGFLPAPASGPVTKDAGGTLYTWGESFVPILEKNIAGHEDVVELRIGDFLKETWTNRAIEICFIDLAKTNDLNLHAFRQFFPAFAPGKTLLVQQDFFFDRLPWIKVLMGYLSDYFEWLGQVGPSSLYRYVKPIPKEMYNTDRFRGLPLEERVRLHQLGDNDMLPVRRRFAVAMSLCYLYETAGPEEALKAANRVKGEFSDYVAADASAARRLQRAIEQFERQARRNGGRSSA